MEAALFGAMDGRLHGKDWPDRYRDRHPLFMVYFGAKNLAVDNRDWSHKRVAEQVLARYRKRNK